MAPNVDDFFTAPSVELEDVRLAVGVETPELRMALEVVVRLAVLVAEAVRAMPPIPGSDVEADVMGLATGLGAVFGLEVPAI